jgi:ribosomal protein S18 acetylase RimI-like enzyme
LAYRLPGESVILTEREDGIRILQIRNLDEALPYRASFAGVYQTVYLDPPYMERFYPAEAASVLQHNLGVAEHITLLAVKGQSSVVGFGLATPMASRPEISRQLRGLISIKHSFYLAELGVLETHRNRGIGMQLIKTRMQLIDSSRYTHVVLRTSVAKDPSYKMFHDIGFEDMGVYSEVSARRTDGTVRTDRRLFLSRLLQQPEAG